ncbi:MAG: nucleotidyltransferase family protein, partial [Paracoccaceae bacterium]
MTGLAVLIPAAGASARMLGRDKLTETIDGQPLLARTARRALSTGAAVIVTLPPDDGLRSAALAGLDVTMVTVPDATEGVSASFRAGISALPHDCVGVLILLADMPDLEAADLAAMLADWRENEILRATTADGQPGHPVIFPRACFRDLSALSGDDGARSVIAAHRQRL